MVPVSPVRPGRHSRQKEGGKREVRAKRREENSGPRMGSRGGFSLIEVVVVVLVVATLAVTMGIGANSLGSNKLYGAVRKLASDIRYAQQLAMTERSPYGVLFNLNLSGGAAPNTYTVFQQSSPLDLAARDPAGGANMIINYNTDPHFQGVTISAPSFCDGVNPCQSTLQFNGQGVPTNTTGPLVSGSVVLGYQGATLTVSVVPQTGKINY